MRYAALVAALLLPCFAFAADAPQPLSLAQAQEIALRQHPQVLASEMREKAAGEDVGIARANYLPQVTGNAAGAYADSGETRLAAVGGLNDPTVFGRGSYGVSASQLITDFGRTGEQVAAARAQQDAAAARSLSAREQVLFAVTRAYYDVLRAQHVLDVATVTRKARGQFLEQVSAMRDAKLRSDLDLGMGQQAVSEADLLVNRAKNDLDNARAELSQALGFATEQDFTLEDKAEAPAPQAALEGLLVQAKQQNPELAALRSQLAAARAQEAADRAANYPTVSAVGYAGGSPARDSGSGLDANYAAAGVLVSIPFYTGGRISATQHRSTYEARALEEDVADKGNRIEREVREDWNNMQVAYQNIAVTARLQKTADEVLELTSTRYQLGKNSIVDLAQAQLGQTEAAIANANAKYDYLTQRALLDFVTGANPQGKS